MAILRVCPFFRYDEKKCNLTGKECKNDMWIEDFESCKLYVEKTEEVVVKWFTNPQEEE